MDPSVFKAISDYGVTLVALVALAGLTWWFIRDLKSQRDRALDGWSAQIASNDKLTNTVNDLVLLVKDREKR